MKKNLFKALLTNQADFTVSTLVVSGEKQQFCLQHATKRDSRSCPTSYNIKTCLGPHWKHMWDKDTAKAFCSLHTGVNCSSITQTLWLFFCCATQLIPISLVPAAVILIRCFLGTSLWLYTVVWTILVFLLAYHFIFSCSIPHVLPYFTLLTKFPDFQTEGVMSRGVK